MMPQRSCPLSTAHLLLCFCFFVLLSSFAVVPTLSKTSRYDVSGLAGPPVGEILVEHRGVAKQASRSRSRNNAANEGEEAKVETEPHTAVVVLMHGLGDSAKGFHRLAQNFAKRLPHVKFVLPTAPKLAVTLNGGRVMNAWYDVESLPRSQPLSSLRHDMQGLRHARNIVERIVKQEQKKHAVDRDRVVLAGFSQGAVVSLFAGLSNADRESGKTFAGIVSLSGYLPGAEMFQQWSDPEAVAKVPILQCHGREDPVISFAAAEATRDLLRTFGCEERLDFEGFDGLKHSTNKAVLQKFLSFLRKVLPPLNRVPSDEL